MNHSSDAEQLHSMVLLLKMRGRSTDELTRIWVDNDRKQWKDNEIEAAGAILLERGAKAPEQKKPEEKPLRHAEKSYADDWFWDPFSERRILITKVWAAAIGLALLGQLLLVLLALLFR